MARPSSPGRENPDPDARRRRHAEARAATAALARPLSAEDCALQSMPDASPVKWHLAHTSWFFETFVLERFAAGYRPFDPAFRMLFNSYYNAIGPKHPRPWRGLVSRPSLADILAYRAHVDTALEPLFERAACDPPLAELLELGLQHEQQHQELILTDVLHLFSRNPLQPAYRDRGYVAPSATARAQRWLTYPGGPTEIGHAGTGFRFDNEVPRHRAWVAPFLLAARPVTQAEFTAFIDDGGYRRPELWLSLGWDIVGAEGWTAPPYWSREDGDWTTFTLDGPIAAEPHAPVAHVSYFEADAFARWAGARLPTEAEWETASAGVPVAGNLAASGALRPVALDRDAEALPLQLFGDCWEWTQSAYAPYPGFAAAPGAVGEYNGKFMCNQYVLRGGSCATPASHIRATYRNFFPPEARWQFSGIRLARDGR